MLTPQQQKLREKERRKQSEREFLIKRPFSKKEKKILVTLTLCIKSPGSIKKTENKILLKK